MRSIRQKLFLQVAILLLTTLALIWLANVTFLEDYYIAQQKQELLENYNTLNAIDTDALANNFRDYIKIESRSNVVIIITEEDGALVYTSRDYLNNTDFMAQSEFVDYKENSIPLPRRRLPGNDDASTNTKQGVRPGIRTTRLVLPNEEIINDDVSFSSGVDPLTGGQSIALIGQLSNGYIINLRTPIASVQNSIDVTNQFLVIIGAGVMLLGMAMTFVFSTHFTKPIKEISRVTGHMKKLNFDQQCLVHSHDELGALAVNVNEMSQVLSTTITDLNTSNQQLLEEIDTKDRLDEKRRQLLNNVSHELKTPLALMEGYAEALQLGIHTDPAKVDFYCDVIMDETEKMNLLVQSLLNIDQLEFGDLKSHPVQLNLSDYLSTTLLKYQPQCEKAGIKLSANLPKDVYVHADPLRLEQVFINYLTNAIHYATDDKKVSVRLVATSQNALIYVHNSAQAFTENQMSKIWDSFYKIDKARSRDKSGHGLGLSIVKAIQSSDGLAYGVDNEGDGVTFWFEVLLGEIRN